MKEKIKVSISRPSFEFKNRDKNEFEKLFLYFGCEVKRLTYKKAFLLLEVLMRNFHTDFDFLSWSKHYSLICHYRNLDGSENSCEALGQDLIICIAKMIVRMSFALDVCEIRKILRG